MEKKKISFKERFKAFRDYWKENWKRDCLFGFLCLALGFCVARCTAVENNTVSADEINLEDDYAITLLELSNISDTENVYRFNSNYAELVYCSSFPSSLKVIYGATFYTIERRSSDGRFRVLNASNGSIRNWFFWDNFLGDSPIFSFREFSGYVGTSNITYEITSSVPVFMYRVVYYPLGSPSVTSSLFDTFNGATLGYSIYRANETTPYKSFSVPLSLSSFDTSFSCSPLFEAMPQDIKDYVFSSTDREEITVNAGNIVSTLNISELNVVGVSDNYSGVDSYVMYIDSNFYPQIDLFTLSYFGSFSRNVANGSYVSDYATYPNYEKFVLNIIVENSNIPLRDRLDSVIFSFGNAYENGYSSGYDVGYYYAMSVVDYDIDTAYNNGYNSAYNTVDTSSPNYNAGYSAGLSTADGSWVLSPVNAVNTLMSLDLFSVGDFHFKLSYLVYIAFGGLLVGILIRFLFHS